MRFLLMLFAFGCLAYAGVTLTAGVVEADQAQKAKVSDLLARKAVR